MIEKRLSSYLKINKEKIQLAIGEIELKKQLGQGGNGVVYSGVVLGKKVALKFLLSNSRDKTKRFLAEYFNIVSLEESKGIVRYIDYDELIIEDEYGSISVPVILMKQYENTLSKIQFKHSKDGFLKLFKFLIDTIEKIHNQGIIHRDLKPENILVDNSNYVLTDFGIASYNPEIFSIMANTDKGDRMGNRLFSAPEQEQSGIKAHETMDIYAIGQIMQWYVTGETHRGTKRHKITSIYEGLKVYDSIIEKCLSQNPINRFQNIQEIRTFIERSKEKDIFEYIHDFNEVVRSNFPKNDSGFVHSSDAKRIDRLFQTFKNFELKFGNHLWWHDGSGNFEFTLDQKGDARWKFWDNEYSIKEIWVYYDSSNFNDFVLVHFQPSEPFIINGEKTFYTAIVDDQHHISYSEHQNGFAEIDDQVVKLSDHKVEFIERQEEEGYFFIGTRFHCVLRKENDKILRNFITELKENQGQLNQEKWQEFQWEIRKNIHDEVFIRL